MSSLVVHFEIHASEPQRLIDFYSRLLGWRFERYGDLPYWTIDTGEGSTQMDRPGNGINGGLTQREGPAPDADAPVSGANLVVGVDDADAVFVRGLELGGTEAMAPDDMPGIGRLAYLRDPEGNTFGVISAVLSDGTNPMQPQATAVDPMQVTPEP
jgi:predicted enzyme related to lactoylglutathione lyase